MKPDELFNLILTSDYSHTGLGVDYTIVLDTKKTIAYILFQGSTTADDWVHDFDFLPKPCKPYKDMPRTWYCHAGIAKMYKSARDEIISVVEALFEDLQCWELVVAGHSQGGGLAQMCAEDLAYRGYCVSCITFGSPRVFYGCGAKRHFDEMPIYCKCYENGSDIVPHIPPLAYNMDSTHVGERFNLLKVFDTPVYHMGYGDATLYEVTKD